MFTILGADGKEYGPVSAEKVLAWVKARRADLKTKARRDGETEWKTLGEFAEFAAATPATAAAACAAPPPPPSTVASMMGTPAPTAAASEELEPAGRGSRLLAQIIDGLTWCILGLPGWVLLILGRGGRNGPLTLAGASLLALGMLAVVILQCYLLTTRGQTVGKKLMNIKIVVFDDDANPGFVKAVLLRLIVNGIIGLVPIIGFIYTLVDICFIFREDRRCIHDLIAGTKVVKA
jgi:uncharacterized RDD family membrane protein YckC